MPGLVGKVGNYLHAEGCRATKTFETGGVPRSFTVVLSGAEDRGGLIGSENNGIVVIDDDNMALVLDRHAKVGSGYSRPSRGQLAELKRVMGMDWTAFSAFCRENPRYRGGMPDATSPRPDEGRAPVPDRVIYPESAKPDASCPYDFGLTTRRQIVDRLKGQAFHGTDGRDSSPSWDVKVGRFDTGGRGVEGASAGCREENDLRWEKVVEADAEGVLFAQACESGLSQYAEGSFSTWMRDSVDARFEQAGRSNGHLCLTRLDGVDLSFRDAADWHRFLEDEEECGDAWLVGLYQAVVTLDHDLADPRRTMEYEYASLRSAAEEEWRAEADALPAAERAEIATAEAAGARFYEQDGEWHVRGGVTSPDEVEAGPFGSRVEAAREYMAEVGPRHGP